MDPTSMSVLPQEFYMHLASYVLLTISTILETLRDLFEQHNENQLGIQASNIGCTYDVVIAI